MLFLFLRKCIWSAGLGSSGDFGEGQGARTRVILVLRESTLNTPLTLPAPWVLLRVELSIPLFK